MGCGTEQILVVFEDHAVTGEPLEQFLLTDLCGIRYAVRKSLHFTVRLVHVLHVYSVKLLIQNARFRVASSMKLHGHLPYQRAIYSLFRLWTPDYR